MEIISLTCPLRPLPVKQANIANQHFNCKTNANNNNGNLNYVKGWSLFLHPGCTRIRCFDKQIIRPYDLVKQTDQ